MTELVAFDLESDAQATRDLSGLGITCAATWTSTDEGKVWHGLVDDKGVCAARMTPEEVQGLIDYLWNLTKQDFLIISWNGLSFDFPVLGHVGHDMERCIALAWDHVDIAFNMLCDRGFMIGLAAAGVGAGLGGKLTGMSGAAAPELWSHGKDFQQTILKYVARDARLTLGIYQYIVKTHQLPWTAQSGRRNVWVPTRLDDQRLPTAAEALYIPEPDVSWMTRPKTRKSCYAWTDPEGEVSPIDTTTMTTLELDLEHDSYARMAATMYASLIQPQEPTRAQEILDALQAFNR